VSFFNKFIRFALPLIPKFIVGRIARRYVAGATLNEAISAVRRLNAEGAAATLDFLGEEVSEKAATEAGVEEYLRILEAIDRDGLDCNISVKPTLFGLRIDEKLCPGQPGPRGSPSR